MEKSLGIFVNMLDTFFQGKYFYFGVFPLNNFEFSELLCKKIETELFWIKKLWVFFWYKKLFWKIKNFRIKKIEYCKSSHCKDFGTLTIHLNKYFENWVIASSNSWFGTEVSQGSTLFLLRKKSFLNIFFLLFSYNVIFQFLAVISVRISELFPWKIVSKRILWWKNIFHFFCFFFCWEDDRSS